MSSGPKQQKNSRDRRKIRQWLVSVEGGGDGEWVECAFGCGTRLNVETLTIDHYPIPRWAGGTMNRSNVRAACEPCNHRDGEKQAQARKESRLEVYDRLKVVVDRMAINALNETVGMIRKRPLVGLCAVVGCKKAGYILRPGEMDYVRGTQLCPEHLKKEARRMRTELGG